MNAASRLFGTLAAILAMQIGGCASTPLELGALDRLPAVTDDKARIVVTREKQLAGAGSPIVILDIGEGIQANGMFYSRDQSVEEIQRTKNYASITGVTSDRLWLWFNPNEVDPLICTAASTHCIADHWRWPKAQRGTLLYGHMIVVDNDCVVQFDAEFTHDWFEALRQNSLEPTDLRSMSSCDKLTYYGQDKIASLVPFIDKLIVEDFFIDFLDGPVTGYLMPSQAGYAIPMLFAAERHLDGATWRVDYQAFPLDPKRVSRNVQVVGTVEVGDMLVWDRAPGTLRLGSAWWDGLGFMPDNLQVEAGKTYHLHYTTRFNDQRWELMENKR